mmetsp:Transcript_76343/g.210758  ORF Transcript_76343/g.210758 Transcript_76343/m.210758 type:complete len:252 (-) Transcript_76343:43-798(-)
MLRTTSVVAPLGIGCNASTCGASSFCTCCCHGSCSGSVCGGCSCLSCCTWPCCHGWRCGNVCVWYCSAPGWSCHCAMACCAPEEGGCCGDGCGCGSQGCGSVAPPQTSPDASDRRMWAHEWCFAQSANAPRNSSNDIFGRGRGCDAFLFRPFRLFGPASWTGSHCVSSCLHLRTWRTSRASCASRAGRTSSGPGPCAPSGHRGAPMCGGNCGGPRGVSCAGCAPVVPGVAGCIAKGIGHVSQRFVLVNTTR